MRARNGGAAISRPRSAGRFGLPALLLLAILPVAFASIPGMTDLPDHIARYAVLAAASDDPLRAIYAVRWAWVGNLGVDLPVVALAPVLGVETATRLVVGAIAPLTVLGLWMIGRTVHGRTTAGTLLALPFAFAQPYLFGFVNYCLAVALALIVAAFWLRRPADGAVRALGFAVAAILVWTAHVEGSAVLLVIVGGIELAQVRDVRDFGMRAVRAVPLLAPLIPMLAWRGTGAGFPARYADDLAWSKVMNLVTVLKGTTKPVDLAITGVILLVAMTALLLATRPRLDARLALGAALLALAALLLPTTIFDSWGADIRLVPVAAMLAMLAIAPARRETAETRLLTAAALIFAARVAIVALLWAQGSARYEARLKLLDRVPRGGRMAYLYTDRDCRTAWTLTPDTKLGAYATIRRHAYTNTLFDVPNGNMLVLRDPADARWWDGSQWVAPSCPAARLDRAAIERRLDAMAASRFDTIWLVGATPAAPHLPRGYTVVYAAGPDLLLRRR